ncbi:MAG: Zn-dependent oligopeptidase [Deltaproteobacteria bacterium]|nr:Zn-dependent oligopeptidase [Deltaproteobacteria bacterium]
MDPLTQRCRERLEIAKSQREALASFATPSPRAAPATLTAVVNALNELTIAIDLASAESSLMFAVHPDKAVRDAAAACEQQTEKLKTEIALDRALYDALAKLDVSAEGPDVKRLVALTLRDFRLAGVDKDDATRARIKRLQDELVQVGQAFEKAIASDVRKVALAAGQLKGLPQDWIDAHKPNADGKVEVSTDYPDYIPFMQYADDDAARKALYVAYRQRGWPANQLNLQKMLETRHELAQSTGFATWAERVTADKMIKNATAVGDFVTRVAKAAEPRMKAEYQVLLGELKGLDKSATEVNDWQQAYLQGRVKKAKFAFDAQAMRPYLHYDKVKSGLLDLTSRLFGITYKAKSDAQVWHPSVEVYDVLEGDKHYGTIYLDMHPREGKYKHAAQFTLVNGVAGRQRPAGVLVCNFPNPKSGNGLMEHKEVETFFHEFGHLLHHTFGGHQAMPRFSGVATEWDFVEAPSQIFEEWAKDYGTLQAFATNDKAEPLPEDLVKRLVAADEFGKGLWVRHQMFYAGLSLGMHHRDPKGLDQDALVAEVQSRYSPYKAVADTHMQASFGHLNGYSAIYYTYMWSMVIAKDMFSRFAKEGIGNPAVAMRYRKLVLEPGGSKDAADLVADFLGRPYDFKSYEAWLNKKK